ncbi:MAG: FecR domain-containing protein, partial [Candidatus Rokuibacteriota bacterium]
LVLVILAAAVPAAGAGSAPPAPASPRATLTVLAPPVHHFPAGGQSPLTEGRGTDLREGDRVVTGQGGRALITFLDGSTVTMEPDSDVTVRQADPERSIIRVLIHVGKVWARVARLVGRESSISLESNAYAATAHDGLIGAQDSRDGTFVCWTRAGRVTLADARGRRLADLAPGQKATAAGLGRPWIESFSVNASALEIVASGEALPLLRMPDGQRVAGYVEPDREVNQVFGSLTLARPGTEGLPAARLVEVPAGHPGPYRLVLAGLGDGPFRVTIIGRHEGVPVWHQVETGTIRAGEHLMFSIQQRVERLSPRRESDGSLSVGDPSRARTLSGVVVPEPPRTAGPAR